MPRLVVPICERRRVPPTSRWRVEVAMQREDQRDVLGDLEIVRRDLDALARSSSISSSRW